MHNVHSYSLSDFEKYFCVCVKFWKGICIYHLYYAGLWTNIECCDHICRDFSSTLLKVVVAILWYVICNIGFPCCPCMKSSFALFLVCNIISLLTAISPFVPQWGEMISEWAFLFLCNCVFTRYFFFTILKSQANVLIT